jgi:DNA ligase-1
MLLAELAATSHRVAATSRRLRRSCARRLPAPPGPEEIEIAVVSLGETRQNKLGVDRLPSCRHAPLFPRHRPLSLSDVDGALESIAQTSGSGSIAERKRLLASSRPLHRAGTGVFVRPLFRAAPGALEGVLEAIAQAAQVPAREVRRAARWQAGWRVQHAPR